jgi:hypothetical protein
MEGFGTIVVGVTYPEKVKTSFYTMDTEQLPIK